jgi:hypothetical protein
VPSNSHHDSNPQMHITAYDFPGNIPTTKYSSRSNLRSANDNSKPQRSLERKKSNSKRSSKEHSTQDFASLGQTQIKIKDLSNIKQDPEIKVTTT